MFIIRGGNPMNTSSAEDPRLSHLLTYTTFHLGVYISLVTAFVGAGLLELGIGSLWLQFSSFCILVAGGFGGTIASNIPSVTTYTELRRGKLKALGIPIAPVETCIRFEHGFFWLGILPPALAFIFGGPEALK
jgi:hypothetical protein